MLKIIIYLGPTGAPVSKLANYNQRHVKPILKAKKVKHDISNDVSNSTLNLENISCSKRIRIRTVIPRTELLEYAASSLVVNIRLSLNANPPCY